MKQLPCSLTEITAEWVCGALADTYPGSEATTLHHGTVLHGTATKVWLLLTYNEAGRAHRLPPTVWAMCRFEAHSDHPHVCIGQHLARLEMARALQALLDRFPTLRLDPDRPAPRVLGLNSRTAPESYVRFEQ